MSKKHSSNTKQRREVEEENQHHHMRAQKIRENSRINKDVERALKNRDYQSLLQDGANDELV